MSNITIAVGIPRQELAEFAGLPDAVRADVNELLDILRQAAAHPRPLLALAEAAAAKGGRRGWSEKSLQRKWYAYRASRDWHCLIDRARHPEGRARSEWMTPAVLEYWRSLCQLHNRSFKSAYNQLVLSYRRGEHVGDIDWRAVWERDPELADEPAPRLCPPNMKLPEGWSYANFTRYRPKTIETVAARIGPHAAKHYGEQVWTTRANLHVGEQYEFDDMWHNADIVYPGQPKPVRALELCCIDISSDHKAAYGLKPRLSDSEGKRLNLSETDMRFLLAHVLCDIGFYKGGCTLFVEGGTAAVRKDLERILAEVSGGLVRVSTSGVDRRVMAGSWGAENRGNPDHKAHVESWHNLAQNRLDGLPGYVGGNSRLSKPESLGALEAVVGRLLAAQATLPPDLAQKLLMPVLDWQTFTDIVAEVYRQIDDTRDHALEGWETRTVRQWRAHPADLWHSEAEFLAKGDAERAALAPVLAQPGMSRVAKMSRGEWWRQGQGDLVRLPGFAAAMIMGPGLAEARPCPAEAEIIFVDREKDPRPMAFRLGTCTGPEGRPAALQEGRTYLWAISPFDTRRVFVSDAGGGYVGQCERAAIVDRADAAAIGARIGETRKEFDRLLSPIARRGAAQAKANLAMMEHDIKILKQASAEEGRRLTEENAVTAERRSAAAGISLADLQAGGNEEEEAPDAGSIGLDDLN